MNIDPSFDIKDYPQERKRCKIAFDLFDRDERRMVVKEEIGTIMRYLGSYPTEEELVRVILPHVQDDEETQHVSFERFEPFMVKVLVEKRFEPDTEETILHAFKTLDIEGKGHIDEQTMVELLTSNESAFREKEIEDFLRVARDSDTGYVYYEDYVSAAVSNN